MANLGVEHDHFFDAPEEINVECDSASNDSEDRNSEIRRNYDDSLDSLRYDFWIGNTKSIDERRDDFIRQTGFVIERCHTAREGPDGSIYDDIEASTSGVGQNQDTVDDLLWRIRCSNDGKELSVNELDDNGKPRRLHEVGGDRCVTVDEYQKTVGTSDLVEKCTRQPEVENDAESKTKGRGKESWLKRMSMKASNALRKERSNKKLSIGDSVFGSGSEKVRVHSHKKLSKELSSLYRKQDFLAHQGSILCMKFSLDGQHLATGGEDGTLHVWKVVEDEKPIDPDIISVNSAATCLYFSVNGISNFASFFKIKDEGNVIDKLKKSSESASVMIPRKVFRILEEPLHEFHGHGGDILDISWAKEGHLLSSSVDKTVRLWQVGCDHCLRVFPHGDYVTCAQFSPVDDNYFISGSIDGLVRMWEVIGCQVVDWIDVKEIVTAVCYRPDAKGGIVGSMAGNCSFFGISDDYPQPFSFLYLQGKKKLTSKRITGFQYSPSDPSEVVVSSADSLVRILRGEDLICKLRGSLPIVDQLDGSQIYASFTSDGQHVISATDDSDIYIWNHINRDRIPTTKLKNIWACESFSSENALVAVPWHGMRSESGLLSLDNGHHNSPNHNQFQESLEQGSLLPSSSTPSINQRVSSIPTPSGATTLPKRSSRKLSPTTLPPTVGKLDSEFLRSACDTILSGSHMWGLVIVTGGKDGRIKTYHNYGLPVRSISGKSLKSSFSFCSFKNRCSENGSRVNSGKFTDGFP